MDGRQQRGMQIAADGGVKGSGGLWQVRSQSQTRRLYAVNPETGQCTCPDSVEGGFRCKHVWAVKLTMTAEVTFGDSVTTQRVTYSQEWTTYNRAQVDEKDTFMRLLADLCSNVPQPVQTNGRPRLPLADMAFAATFKVYSRFSSRRFSSDLREAQERGLIVRAPHFNSVSNYMSDPGLTPVLYGLIESSARPLTAVERDFAVDSTGFSTGRFDRWIDYKYGKPVETRIRRRWLKAHVMVGVRTNIVTSVQITPSNEHDGDRLPSLMANTAERFQIAEVSADKAYLSRRNAAAIEAIGATPYIPFMKNSKAPVPTLDGMQTAWDRMWHAFSLNRDAFDTSYHKRSNVETAFSMVKSKFGDSVLSKSDTGQQNEVLCKLLAHNIVVVGHEALALGITPAFCAGSPVAQKVGA